MQPIRSQERLLEIRKQMTAAVFHGVRRTHCGVGTGLMAGQHGRTFPEWEPLSPISAWRIIVMDRRSWASSTKTFSSGTGCRVTFLKMDRHLDIEPISRVEEEEKDHSLEEDHTSMKLFVGAWIVWSSWQQNLAGFARSANGVNSMYLFQFRFLLEVVHR